MSTGRVVTFEASDFEPLSAAGVGYMATCSAPGGRAVSARLSRLFSAVTLPGLSADVLLSIHAPRLQRWLRDTKQSGEELARRIVTATEHLYRAIRERLRPTAPHLVFSHHDLQKVFGGMCLWRPDPSDEGPPRPPTLLPVAQLWTHECARTFADRLSSEDERRALLALVAETAAEHFGGGRPRSDPEEPAPRGPAEEPVYGPELSGAPTPRGFHSSARYRARDLDAVLRDLRPLVHGQEDGGGREVVHRQSARQLLHVLRALLLPGGHGVLMGSGGGTGRKTAVRLAARLAGCRLMEVHSGNEDRLRNILKEAGNQTRADGAHVVLLAHEGLGPHATEQLLLAMARPEAPGLYTEGRGSGAAAGSSRRNLMDRFLLEE